MVPVPLLQTQVMHSPHFPETAHKSKTLGTAITRYEKCDISTDTCDLEDDLEDSQFCFIIPVCNITLFLYPVDIIYVFNLKVMVYMQMLYKGLPNIKGKKFVIMDCHVACKLKISHWRPHTRGNTLVPPCSATLPGFTCGIVECNGA